MKPFSSFYDPKAMDPPYSKSDLDKIEYSIYKDVEMVIKQVRSTKNMSSKIRKNAKIQASLKVYMDFLEDVSCERIDASSYPYA